MPFIRFLLADGSERQCEVEPGTSVMHAAIQNNVPGIDAECGGSLDCATCHCYVAEAQFARLPPPSAMEVEMLDVAAFDRRPTSRLGCQIIVASHGDALHIQMVKRQR